MEHSITWNYLIAIYLFTAGLSAGAAVLGAWGDLAAGIKKLDERITRVAAYLAPFPVMLGLLCLVLDLHRPWNFFQVLIHYNITSVMSWGAFFLLVFPIIALAYAGLVYWNINGPIRKITAWLEMLLGLGIGIYAGLLLAAIYTNPVWGNPIIAFLFLVSAFSTGVCMVILAGKNWDQLEENTLRRFLPEDILPEQKFLNFDDTVVKTLLKLDALLIVAEIIVIITLIISWNLLPNGHLALGAVVTGGYYLLFWVGVLLLGLIVPLILGLVELLEATDYLDGAAISMLEPILVLAGGFLLRYVIVYGGQIVYPILTMPG
ncbi:MAG: NrfD/PsrC family molybdoenzyme membrane anchor subunit [Syntrophomonas sp.]